MTAATTQLRSTRFPRWLQLVAVIVMNALLQALLVAPSPWGTSLSALATAIGSLIVLGGSGYLAVRILRNGRPDRVRRSPTPWRIMLLVIGTLFIAAICWPLALLSIAFLPGPVAIIVAWILIGALASLPISWWVHLGTR